MAKIVKKNQMWMLLRAIVLFVSDYPCLNTLQCPL